MNKVVLKSVILKYDDLDGVHGNFHSKWPKGFFPKDAGLPENYLKCYIWYKFSREGGGLVLRGGIPVQVGLYADLESACQTDEVKKQVEILFRKNGEGKGNPLTKFVTNFLNK